MRAPLDGPRICLAAVWPAWDKPDMIEIARMLAGFVLLAGLDPEVSAQAPVIASFNRNGELVSTNLQPGTVASVEWAASVLGPWTNTWAGLDAVTADSNGTIRV